MPELNLSEQDAHLLAQIQTDLSAATTLLSELPSGVTVFGSARTAPDDAAYQCAWRLGSWLGRAGLPVLTGGGPGIMEAVNRGAREADGISVGLNIELPYEQTPNPHLTHQLHFHHFSTRKLMLTRYSRGFVIFPGGFGTTDELLELLVAFHTDRGARYPMVLVDSEFWSGLLNWFTEQLGSRRLIDLHNTDFIEVVDDEKAALGVLLGAEAAADLMGRYPD
ncbi:MAG: TIGR00730 family Rossman fold protein [Alteromonadaceae bacterium]|nr:TIGR00730 family Rossman fold protein [Alteromonadaceae bacterium]